MEKKMKTNKGNDFIEEIHEETEHLSKMDFSYSELLILCATHIVENKWLKNICDRYYELSNSEAKFYKRWIYIIMTFWVIYCIMIVLVSFCS